MKKLFVISGIALVVGLILMISGLAMGAKKGMYMDSTGIHVVDDNENGRKSVTEHNLKAFDKIDLNVISYHIEFVQSKTFGLEIENNQNRKIDWSADNKTLKITEPLEENFFRIFNIDFSFMFGRYKPQTIRIYLPANTALKDIYIKDTSGKVELSDFSSEKAYLDVISGNIKVTNGKIDDFTAKRASGNLEMNQCELGVSNFSVISGKTVINDSIVKGLNITSTSGKIDFNGTLSGNTDIYSISGNVNLSIKGKTEDYRRDISMISGNLYVNGVKSSSDANESTAKYNLKIKTVSGGVKLNFED